MVSASMDGPGLPGRHLPRALRGLWAAEHRGLLGNAGSLVATTALTSGLGFVYWWLAARTFPAPAVGFAAASISAMLLLGAVGVLGLGTLLIGELARHPGRERSVIVTAAIPAAVGGGALGVVFALAAPLVATDLAGLAASPLTVALFAAGVSLTAVTLVSDQAVIGLLRGDLQLGRNALFALAKLGALALVAGSLASDGGLAIYATWLAGNALSLVALAFYVVRRGGPAAAYRPQWGLLRGLGRSALAHHALNLALQAPQLMLPTLVTAVLSATANAYFYVAWMVAGFVCVGSTALATSLYAAGARAPATLPRRLRFSLGLALLGALLGNAVLWVAADWLLGMFGGEYAAEAAWTLRLLTLAAIPLVVRDHYVAVCRLRGGVSRATVYVTASAALGIALAMWGALAGQLPGLAGGYVLALTLQVICMVPTLARVVGGDNRVAGPGQPQDAQSAGGSVESGSASCRA